MRRGYIVVGLNVYPGRVKVTDVESACTSDPAGIAQLLRVAADQLDEQAKQQAARAAAKGRKGA